MNKKILIIYAHPEIESHNSIVLKTVTERLDKDEINYNILDLYKMKFNPVLDKEDFKKTSTEVLNIQAEIKKRDNLIFIYPIWWGTMPAILKGFIDKVFSANFAFVYKNSIPHGLLKDKKALVLVTSGAPKIINILTCNRYLKGLTRDVLKFCGIKSKGYIFSHATNFEKNKLRLEREITTKLNRFL